MRRAADKAILSGAADELAELRAGLDDLASLTAGLIGRLPPAERTAALERAQAFDLIDQRLAALGALAGALAGGAPVAKALAGVPLSQLSDRLGARAAPPAQAGDLTLFD